MAVWIFTISGWLLLLTGVFIAWRFGWRDPGKGTRRCPKCGYDMTATSGLRCSECGHEALSEKRLRRRRIRRRWIVVGAMVALVSWFPFKWPEYQRLSKLQTGVLAFVPKTVLVVTWPWIVNWQVASSERPGAWWAKSQPNTFWNLDEAVRPSALWRWQRYLLAPSLRHAFLQRDSIYRFNTAADFMFDAKDYPSSVGEAYVAGFCQAPAAWGLRFVRDRHYWYPFPEGAAHAVAAELERHPSRMYFDDHTLWWLSRNGASVDPVARAFVGSKPGFPRLQQMTESLSTGTYTPDTAALLLGVLRSASSGNLTAAAQLLRSADLRSAEFDPQIEQILAGKDLYAAGFLCEAIARGGEITPATRRVLETVACNEMSDARFLARITLASLDNRLADVPGIIAAAHEDARQHADLYAASMRLSGLYRFGTLRSWPRDLRWQSLWAAIDKRPTGSLMGDCYSATLELVREFGDEQRTVAAFAGELKNNLAYSWVALDEYTKKGSVPKPLLDAAKQFVATQDSKSQENLRKRFEALR